MRRRMTRGRAGRAIRQVLPFFFERLEQRTLLAVSPALLNSWFVSGQGQFAEVYVGQTGGAVVGPSTTWTTQTSPVIGDVQKVSFSSATNTVYVNTPDLASYVMGAWWGNAAHTTPFQNLPKDQNAIYKITLNEAYPSVTHSLIGGGTVGIAVNGVSLFNNGDAFSYSHATSSEVGPPSGDGLFNRLAAAVEAVTFDVGNGHQPQTGEYHYHEDPIALRAQLDDNVDYVGTTNYFPYDPAVYYLTHGGGSDGDFSEVTTALHHSPIIGWAFDGYPIYGPYGYSDSNDPASAVTRIQSSFSLRSITTRTTLPGWAAQLSGAKLGASATSTSADGVYTMTTAQQGLYAGPAVSTTYPLGRYGEDYAYVPGAGNLDQFNGRWCRTPEFPNGTYAYFTTIDAAGEPAFPYLFGRQYYGQKNGSGKVASITEAVTVSFNVATNTAPIVSGPASFSLKQSATAALTGGLQFGMSDVDEATVESVALAVTAGTLTFDLTGPLASRVSIVSGGNRTGAVTISGAVDELNAAFATLTYTAPTSGTSATLTVQANDGSAANNLSSVFTSTIAIEATNPSIAIASSMSTLNAVQTAAITFTLSAAATNFTVTDVSVAGGVLSGFTGSGTSYTATFTPTAGSTTPGMVSVVASAFTDAAGNPSTAGSLSPAIAIDTVAPTIAIASSASSLRAGQIATITFTLSETSTSFTAADVAVTGGTLSGFAGSGASYSATFTPTAGSTTPGTISVAAGAFTDATGNQNTAGSLSPAIAIDTGSPTAVIPTAPRSVVTVSGNASLAVTWVAPVSTGGSPITDYVVKYSSNSGSTWTTFVHPVSTATSLTVTGLTNGTAYVIKVIAKNAVGSSLPSANSAPVTPATVPGSPTSVVAVSGNAQLAVTWVAPTSTGGSAITDYVVKYSSNNGSTWTTFADPVSTATSCSVTGLTNGTSYVIKVVAKNAAGISPPSANSAPATPAATVPVSPTSVLAVSGNAQLAVRWTAPASTGGSAITDYLVKYSSNGGSTWTNFVRPASTATSCTVTGLTNGTAYVIKVIAKNAVGSSLPSADSAPAVPQAAAKPS